MIIRAFKSILVSLCCRSCNFRAQDDSAWFTPESPSGPYTLDLGRAYDRAVMVDLLHMAATVDAIRINTVK